MNRNVVSKKTELLHTDYLCLRHTSIRTLANGFWPLNICKDGCSTWLIFSTLVRLLHIEILRSVIDCNVPYRMTQDAFDFSMIFEVEFMILDSIALPHLRDETALHFAAVVTPVENQLSELDA